MPWLRLRSCSLVTARSRAAACLWLGQLLIPVVVGGAFVVSTSGCERNESKTVLSYSADAKRAYDDALVEFDAHNWIETQALFREVKRKYSYSKYARLAELRIADADFEQEKFAEAIRGYRQFVHDHRSDADEVAYARSKIAEAQHAEISESFLLPSADERDQAVIIDAFKELKSYVHDYPNAKQASKIKRLLEDATARLMRHEIYVARFYLDRENFEAAVLRVQFAMRTFAGGPVPKEPRDAESPALAPALATVTATVTATIDHGLEAEALLLLGEVYLKMHKFSDAREVFAALLKDYPRSPLVVQANNYLAHMKDRGV